MEYVIGIDVGTGSVRGALVDRTGKIWKVNTRNITTLNVKPDFYTQSSDEIWLHCCEVIKALIQDVAPETVKGLGFDATCSLAVCDKNGNPVAVDPDGGDDQNIILWMDHRAKKEADIINATNHPILKYVGENVSPEMMVPKILWLKRNHPSCWQRAAHFFLLPDFMTWKATGDESRSLCSVVCKCNYEVSLKGKSGWVADYFEALDLQELAEDGWKKIGSKILNPGELCGGLSEVAAKATGLVVGTPVATSLIDAHAGGLGVMGCDADSISKDFTSRLALISGTSTCYMYQMSRERFVPGVWGPYFNAMIPDLWLLEGGQSVSGKLIDHVVETHPAAKVIREKHSNVRLTDYLNASLCAMMNDSGLNAFDELTKDIHVYPDFHGNRSPLANPNLRGMILGLTLDSNETNLTRLYLATIQSLAYGSKHILEALERDYGGEKIKAVLICGGLSKNEIFLQTVANVIGLPVLVPKEGESVLLGSAMLAAKVANFYSDLKTCVLKMGGAAKRINVESGVKKFHDKKYEAYFQLLECQMKIRGLMASH